MFVLDGRCFCRCHQGSILTPFRGADVYDALEAAVACQRCRDGHCPALSSVPKPMERPPRDPFQPPEPFGFVAGDGPE